MANLGREKEKQSGRSGIERDKAGKKLREKKGRERKKIQVGDGRGRSGTGQREGERNL